MNQPLPGDSAGAEIDEVGPAGSADLGPAERSHGRPDPRERLAQPEPIDAAELIELLCADQVHRWRVGERIPVEAYLSLHPTLPGNSDAAFELIYGEYLVRESLGEAPKLEEFFWRFPGFADRLRRQLGLHHAFGDGSLETEWGPGDEGAAADPGGPAVPQVPGFEVLGILGQGGMSVVYLARQAGLNRPVALKVIRAKVYADPEIAARFRDEAEASARFQHPNIVQVYEVGEFEGLGYLALEYAPGGNLQQKLAGAPQPPRAAAETIEYLARALHYAHQRGIVHRDMKPANVVLTEDGIPKVTDFGLAKLLEREAGLTRTGDIMGTPSYMAPEQARGTPADVTAAADIYALGAILYEMLTGRPPFQGSTPLSTLSQAADQDVLPPGRLQRHLPRELETICLKCLEKEPRRRYDSALDLAEDLRRFLEDRPILARRIGRAEWLWRWCRREPVKAGLAAGLVIALVAGFAGVAIQWRRAQATARAEARARGRAERAEEAALDNLDFSRIAQARLEWRLGNIPGARRLLEQCQPGRRGWEWHYLHNLEQSELVSLGFPELSYINAVAFSPDGRRFAFAGHNPYTDPRGRGPSLIEVWETAPPHRLHALTGPGPAIRLEFSPDGRRLATSGPKGARIWDTTTGTEVHAWPAIGTIGFSPDGQALASCREGRVTFWDAATGARIRDFAAATGRVTFGPEGRVVAVSGPEAVELRETATGRELRRLPHGGNEPEERHSRMFSEEGPNLAFSPDGQWLVVATNPPRVWDTATGAARHQLSGHEGSVPGVAFSPDGRRVATAGVDSTIRIWDATTGLQRAVLRGHSAWAACVAFHPEGWCLLSGGRHRADVKLWDLTRPQEYVSLPAARATAMVFDHTGRHLDLVTATGRVQRRRADGGHDVNGPHVDLSQRWQTPAALAEYSADGRRLATVAGDRRIVKVWEPDSGRELARLAGLATDASYLACSRDGGRVAAAGLNRAAEPHRDVIAWDTASRRILASFRPAMAPTIFTHGRVALDGDGRRIAFDDYEDSAVNPSTGEALGKPCGFVRVCEVPGGRDLLRLPMPGPEPIYCIAFSGDGRRLAAGDQDGVIQVWDARTGSVLQTSRRSDTAFRLAFSPDGRRLAAVDRAMLQIRDLGVDRETLILRGAPARPNDGGFNPVLAWSPDGRRLACSNWDQSVSVWDGAEVSSSPAERWTMARDRVFAWHLAEAEAALASESPAAATFHLRRIRDAEPPDATSLRRRAHLYLRLGRMEDAHADYARRLAGGEPDDGDAWLSFARLFLMRGDRAGYDALCARMLDALEQGPHQTMATSSARAIGLAPCSADRAGRLLRLVQLAFVDPKSLRPHDFGALALARYRAGEWESARTALQTAMETDHSGPGSYRPLMAMIQYRLDHPREARAELARAKEPPDPHRTRNTNSIRPLIDEEELDREVLLREADALVGPVAK